MNKLFFHLVMIPSALWRSMGADTGQLRAILNVRLILDDRKPASFGRQSSQKKDRKYGTVLNMFLFLAMGCIYMMPVAVIPDRIMSLTIFFSLFTMLMTLMLITDFSSVLFDARDKYILFPRPVSDRTIVLARLLHVFIYLIRIVLPMSLPAWIILGMNDGWKSALLFPLPLTLLVFMVLFLVNSIYLLVLRLSKPEKFKDVINYFQIIVSVVFFVSAYFLPRFFDAQHRQAFNIMEHTWVQYLPAYWLAACWSWIGAPVSLAGTGFFSIFAVIFPLVCMYLLVRWLAPQFSRRIAGIDAVETAEYNPAKAKQVKGGKLYQKLAVLLNRNDDARAGFMIAWLQTSRSRSFRMKVYPTFAYVPVYFVYNLSMRRGSLNIGFSHLHEGYRHLFLLYMSSFVMMSALTYLAMSEQYKAAWIYYSTPVEKPGQIMIGAYKAMLVKYFLPFFVALSAFVLYIWGVPAIWDIALAYVNVTLFITCMARISFRHLPFSILEQGKQGGKRILKSFVVMIIPATLGMGHYLSRDVLWLKIIFLVLSAIFLWLVWDSYANTSWDNVTRAEAEV